MQLGRKSLVVRDDECRLLYSLDDLGHRKSLAGSGDAHQCLGFPSRKYSVRYLSYRLRLISRRRKITYDSELRHKIRCLLIVL